MTTQELEPQAERTKNVGQAAAAAMKAGLRR
jgi:hypothetical protein